MIRRCFGRLDVADERGATLLIVAIAMVAIFGMLVLTVDFGALAVKRRSMVNSNDAAALAAAETFALNHATAGANEGPARAAADSLAAQNVSNAVHDTITPWWTVSAGVPGEPCAPTTCGSVTVRYQGDQSLFFAPILGLGNTAAIHASATAIWGPAGGGIPAPVMIRFDWMNAECDAPVPNTHPPTNCGFWLNNHEDNGNALWSWINLNPYPGNSGGWNVPQSYNCPNVGSSDRSKWINGIGLPNLPVNPLPSPTFVCTVSGHASSNVSDLQALIGKLRVFPVNDAAGAFAPPGQVDGSGNYCPPGTSCTPEKYDIVGFTILRVDDVLTGDDPLAIGTPGGPGSCSILNDFAKSGSGASFDLDAQACNTAALHYPGDATKLYPKLSRSTTVYRVNVDYTYDASTNVITWIKGAAQPGVTIAWDYVALPSPGKCGTHKSDPNAVCIVASWQGYVTGGINPGGGVGFGLQAVRLAG